MFLLQNLLRRFVEKGRLIVVTHDGAKHAFGTGADGPEVTIRLHDSKIERELFFNPELSAGEAYMDGRMTVENGGSIYDLLFLFSVNRRRLGHHPVQHALRTIWRALWRVYQSNPLGRAARNVRQHYDHPADFYALWLDQRMNYSCAYFTHPEESLEAAQLNKLRHVAAKLKLEPGMSVVDIGSGWGALAIYLAQTCGVRVTAVNVSPEQLAASSALARAAGVADKITFREKDYREVGGRFDRLVSIGMMEFGAAYFDQYFSAVRRLLTPGGFALIHAIGRMSPPGFTVPFIRKYIFPGGYAPALSEVFASTERTGLWVDDCEILRLHYYWTIRNWRLRFLAKRQTVVDKMGERFARMWEFYLVAVELSFQHGSHMVYQLLLSERRDDVPVTRDYMFDGERGVRAREV